MGYKIDLSRFEQNKVEREEVTLDAAIDAMAQMHMKHNVLMDVVSAISSMEPKSDLTVMDAILGATGAEVTEDGVQFDEEAVEYAIGVTMDFAMALGLSRSAIFDMFDTDEEIAMDEAHNFASAINAAIHEESDAAHLVTAYVHMDSIVEEYGDMEDEIVTLDAITTDWAFSKKKSRRKAKTGTGHTMKTVECHRTIDGVREKGFCRYPTSLLKGKYKKASGVSGKQKAHLAEMVTDAHTSIAEQRRAQSMKLTRELHKGASARASKAKM